MNLLKSRENWLLIYLIKKREIELLGISVTENAFDGFK